MHLTVAGDVFDGVFLCCPFSHEMSWMRSEFLRVFLPTFTTVQVNQSHHVLFFNS